LRVVLDADCIVAGTIANSGAAARILNRWRAGDFELVACPELVLEVRQALLRPRIGSRYGVTPDEVGRVCRQIEDESIWLTDSKDPPRRVPSDPDDDYLVALAIDGGADVLVTRDRHFDGVEIPGIRILYPGQLLEELTG
jgi:putative PIN family toxin of toxin-antitoxin system